MTCAACPQHCDNATERPWFGQLQNHCSLVLGTHAAFDDLGKHGIRRKGPAFVLVSVAITRSHARPDQLCFRPWRPTPSRFGSVRASSSLARMHATLGARHSLIVCWLASTAGSSLKVVMSPQSLIVSSCYGLRPERVHIAFGVELASTPVSLLRSAMTHENGSSARERRRSHHACLNCR